MYLRGSIMIFQRLFRRDKKIVNFCVIFKQNEVLGSRSGNKPEHSLLPHGGTVQLDFCVADYT